MKKVIGENQLQQEPYFVFQNFQNCTSSEQCNEVWADVRYVFECMRTWFQDLEVYSLVGFLMAQRRKHVEKKFKELAQLLMAERDKDNGSARAGGGRETFVDELKGEVRKTILPARGSVKNLSDLCERLRYDASNADEIFDVLLLFNIAVAMRHCSRYPFRMHKGVSWTREHISAKNERALEDADLERLLEEIGVEHKDGANRIDEINVSLREAGDHDPCLKGIQVVRDESGACHLVDENLDVHGLGNMALLGTCVNAKFNNGLFLEKRKIVEEWRPSSGAELFPLATQMVYFKLFSTRNTLSWLWTAKDAEDYLDAIQTTLKKTFGFFEDGKFAED